jgi:hypothetical protein
MYVQHNIEACLGDHCCSGKAVSITQPVCASVALRIQHAMPMCHIIMWPAPLCNTFPTLFHKQHNFQKKKLLNMKCVFRVSLQLLSEIFFILDEMSEI